MIKNIHFDYFEYDKFGEIWMEIEIFTHGNRESLVVAELLIVRMCGVPSQLEKIFENFGEFIWRIGEK